MRFRRLLAASGLILALDASVAYADESWHEARSEDFVLVSNAGEHRARGLLEKVLVFRRVLARALPDARLDTSVPTQIYGFRDSDSFAPFLSDAEERSARTSGFFRRGDVKNVIAVDMSAPPSPERTLFHEYVHFVASASEHELPLWLEEGLAELYASTRLAGRSAEIGGARWGHLDRLSNGLLPLTDLLEAALGDEVGSDPLFYAQSWLLVHYFLVGREGGGPEALARYVAGAGEELVDEAELAEYARRGSFETLRYELPVGIDEPSPSVVRLSTAEVQHRWGELFLLTGRLPEARVCLDEAFRLDPGRGPLRETLGLAALVEEDFDAARRHLRAAMELGGATSTGFHLYGRAVLREYSGHFVDEIPEAIAREAEEALRASLRLKPGQSETARLLAFVYLVRGERLKQAEALVRSALLLEPRDPSLHFLEAQLLARQGEYDRARAVLDDVLRDASDPELRRAASVFLARMNVIQRAPCN